MEGKPFLAECGEVKMDTSVNNVRLCERYAEVCQKYNAAPHSGVEAALMKLDLAPVGTTRLLDLTSGPPMSELDARCLSEALASEEDTSGEFDAIDMSHGGITGLGGSELLRLLRAGGNRLRLVDLSSNPVGRDVLRDIFRGGLGCEVLDLSNCRIRKLDLTGRFLRLHTLRLDLNNTITSLPDGSFQSMPNLRRLSLCGSVIANLWTTVSALSHLPSLVELRFQKCACCDTTAPCPAMAAISQKSHSDAGLAMALPVGNLPATPSTPFDSFHTLLTSASMSMPTGTSTVTANGTVMTPPNYTPRFRAPPVRRLWGHREDGSTTDEYDSQGTIQTDSTMRTDEEDSDGMLSDDTPPLPLVRHFENNPRTISGISDSSSGESDVDSRHAGLGETSLLNQSSTSAEMDDATDLTLTLGLGLGRSSSEGYLADGDHPSTAPSPCRDVGELGHLSLGTGSALRTESRPAPLVGPGRHRTATGSGRARTSAVARSPTTHHARQSGGIETDAGGVNRQSGNAQQVAERDPDEEMLTVSDETLSRRRWSSTSGASLDTASGSTLELRPDRGSVSMEAAGHARRNLPTLMLMPSTSDSLPDTWNRELEDMQTDISVNCSSPREGVAPVAPGDLLPMPSLDILSHRTRWLDGAQNAPPVQGTNRENGWEITMDDRQVEGGVGVISDRIASGEGARTRGNPSSSFFGTAVVLEGRNGGDGIRLAGGPDAMFSSLDLSLGGASPGDREGGQGGALARETRERGTQTPQAGTPRTATPILASTPRSLFAAMMSQFRQVSSLCRERHYREFIVVSLPKLEVLDNIRITAAERERAQEVHRDNFEQFPNNRRVPGNVLHTLQGRETGMTRMPGMLKRSGSPSLYSSSRPRDAISMETRKEPPATFQRYVEAAKMASCIWPATKPICTAKPAGLEYHRKYRPRQFEYHPTQPNYMVFGTLHGEVVVVDHEKDEVIGQVQSIGAPHSILGLCWLNRDPSKLVAGSDNGSIQLYDVNQMKAAMIIAGAREKRAGQSGSRPSHLTPPAPAYRGTYSYTSSGRSPAIYTYDDFEQLTSVHINCTDDYFLASGYSNHVGLYDLRTGKRLQIFPNLHREHINVLKFAHHSPHLFATSSFDKDIKMWDVRQRADRPLYTCQSDRGNVMVCFSNDDHYLLSSAVDNEVRQHLAVDGRLHLKFDLPSTSSGHNYTRSYYMNGRDYIITGSCEENVVRLLCARTGRRLRDVALEGRGLKNSLYVQSLRGDPFRDFHFCVLVAYNHPNSRSEIVKVNLMSSNGPKKGSEVDGQGVPFSVLGG